MRGECFKSPNAVLADKLRIKQRKHMSGLMPSFINTSKNGAQLTARRPGPVSAIAPRRRAAAENIA